MPSLGEFTNSGGGTWIKEKDLQNGERLALIQKCSIIDGQYGRKIRLQFHTGDLIDCGVIQGGCFSSLFNSTEEAESQQIVLYRDPDLKSGKFRGPMILFKKNTTGAEIPPLEKITPDPSPRQNQQHNWSGMGEAGVSQSGTPAQVHSYQNKNSNQGDWTQGGSESFNPPQPG